MPDTFSLTEVSNPDDAVIDILFIHGLSGNNTDTWKNSNGTYWPTMVSGCRPEASVYALNYPSSIWSNEDGMDSYEKSNAILNYLVSKGIGKRPFAIICHSLGGIITKMIMRKSSDLTDERQLSFSKNCRYISLVAVPHDGNNLAKIANLCSVSPDIDLIVNHSGYLQNLNEQFDNFASSNDQLKVGSFYGSNDNIVSRNSVRSGGIPIDADHKSICKPENENAPIHCSVVGDLRNLIEELQPIEIDNSLGIESDDYRLPSERDRRSLKEKLQAANRSGEYERANDHQNKFAQSFMKDGLSPSARSQFNDILAEVQQRFETHIYPLIMQNTHHEDIEDTMQSQVIDPVAEQFRGREGFTTQTIQRAIFYLTEQCHVRWDPE